MLCARSQGSLRPAAPAATRGRWRHALGLGMGEGGQGLDWGRLAAQG